MQITLTQPEDAALVIQALRDRIRAARDSAGQFERRPAVSADALKALRQQIRQLERIANEIATQFNQRNRHHDS